jgi:hypothetical protein
MNCVMSDVYVNVHMRWICLNKWPFSSGENNSAVLLTRTGMVDVSINITFNYDTAAFVSLPNQR